MTERHLDLSPPRLRRWHARFHHEHPGVSESADDGELVLTSTDGSTARFRGWYPVLSPEGALEVLTTIPPQVGLILLRRGGYSIGFARAESDGPLQLRDHKSGTAYVQSRTAAGGWSQQRFARRRANQADDLLRTAAEHASRILAPLLPAGGGLVLGGDVFLLRDLLTDPRLAPVKPLATRWFTDIPDPRFAVLEQVLTRARGVAVAVHNP